MNWQIRTLIGAVIFGATLASATADELKCAHQSAAPKGDGNVVITLSNRCPSPITWVYNACTLTYTVDSGVVTVEAGKMFTKNIPYPYKGAPIVFAETRAGGVGLMTMPVCPDPLGPSFDALINQAEPAAPTGEPLRPLDELLEEQNKPSPEKGSISDMLENNGAPSGQ